ncbi:MAG: sigma-70 family RNA polymerase sigma factor [Crocinitomicaceae bacterium]|nr:sigma-70 family RNA polymerase sigma factor [Crocinitomicaceae bacterium]MBT5403452.1 sigma-70 family RNA polymerase sigma factor [Crocinitomicaceae bacterium]MBT6030738.1 sigma-70 family RNA polymerase sigma factor [Crocinitomicaceae bacterium]MBT6513513.1 sigma-70 family RNA polymerase sigma factor [Crocinitomicaceae bacterium]MDG2332415.1 sigma-70 family RNA polymerase sigma factor [Flavobacteriales bacterium]
MDRSKSGRRLPNEQKLIELAKTNPARFAPLYNHYYKPIFIFVFKKVRNEFTCDDIVSKVFLKAILNIKKYEDRGFPFSSWLYRIASNEVNLFYRKSKKVTEVEIMETDVITLMKEIKEGDEVDRQQVVIKCLGDLPIEVSNLIELRFFDRMSFKEMGEVLGITHGNAKIRLYRALDKLKKLVEEQGI